MCAHKTPRSGQPPQTQGAPPDKWCAVCGRRITWRKKWERDWESVRACSDACRRARLDATDAALDAAVLSLCRSRGRGKTICPSEAARAVAGEDEAAWRRLLPRARWSANRLCAAGSVEMTQSGRVVDWSTARGPVRLRVR
jgi:hypothetical protein